MRGSLTGSVVSNILLVLGAAMIAGGDGKVDTRSLRWQLVRPCSARSLLLLIPSIPRWDGGSHERHSLYLLTLPVSVVLLAVYVVITVRNLRIHRAAEREAPASDAWSLRKSLALLARRDGRDRARLRDPRALARRTSATRSGLNEFFIAVVIVAIVGNAAEHGGAVVIAHRGNTTLATEIAITSSMQVARLRRAGGRAALVARRHGLPLSFRAIEIVDDGRAPRRSPRCVDLRRPLAPLGGLLLVGVYGAGRRRRTTLASCARP